MSYQLIPNLIFFVCVLGVIVLILRRLPEAQNLGDNDLQKQSPDKKLEMKGIPAESFNKLQAWFKFWLHKFWSTALEAKDLKPTQPSAYKLKKLFNFRITPTQTTPINLPVAPKESVDYEKELLESIKKEPRNHKHYDALGTLYLKNLQYEDARDIYSYLVGHEAGNPAYHARLGQAAFHLKNYQVAAEHFEKSLALDKMHPNRYYNLGLALECQEKWPEAMQNFARALEMEPKNPKYKSALEKVRKQIN